MATWKEPMEWNATGTAPSSTLKTNGFKAGDKPPADVFNYFLNKTAACINQLQDEVDTTSGKIPTKTSQLTNDSGFKTTDNNTTYTLSKSGSTITLTGSDGKTSSVTDSDTNSTYSLSSFGITATAAELNYTDGVTSNIQTQLNGKAASTHNHTKSQITDFPTSMPASDVYSWAKASTKPSYAWSEITSKPSTFPPETHTHNYAGSSSAGGAATTALACTGNSATATKANSATSTTPVTTAGTGAAYTATVSGISALTVGVSFIMVTHTVSTSTQPTLNVNSLGAKGIRRRLSNITTSLQSGYSNSWLASGKAYHVVYDGTYWIVEDMSKPAAADLYGKLTLTQLPSVSASDNGKVLKVVNGAWAVVDDGAISVGMNLKGKAVVMYTRQSALNVPSATHFSATYGSGSYDINTDGSYWNSSSPNNHWGNIDDSGTANTGGAREGNKIQLYESDIMEVATYIFPNDNDVIVTAYNDTYLAMRVI